MRGDLIDCTEGEAQDEARLKRREKDRKKQLQKKKKGNADVKRDQESEEGDGEERDAGEWVAAVSVLEVVMTLEEAAWRLEAAHQRQAQLLASVVTAFTSSPFSASAAPASSAAVLETLAELSSAPVSTAELTAWESTVQRFTRPASVAPSPSRDPP